MSSSMVNVVRTNDILEVDDLLDDEGWDLLNSLTEEELEQLNSDFDPENSLIPVADRGGMVAAKNAGPMYNQEDLIQGLNKMVENSKTVIKNDKMRAKEEKKKAEREAKLKRQYSRDRPELKREPTVELTAEEEELLAEATEEELIEAAALLKMNGILTNDQIQSVWAGEKPQGSLTVNSHVKATEIKREKRIAPKDEETELDVVALMKHLKEDSDSLFYLCINNQPKLEKKIKQAVIKAVRDSKKIRHLSIAMIGIVDYEAKELAEAIRANDKLETINLESNVITQHGLGPLMKEIARHPSIREVKIANQKQPFGGNGEECMATAIDKNENILKFGYSFKAAGPRNKADRAIIRHNEVLRQKRRNGEDVYDLKAVCKIRDPWPQPWIKVKNRRGLGGLIESRAEAMGTNIDLDNDARRESRGPDLRNAIAKPLNINDLLAQRKAKLKGSKVEELEQEREKKRKEMFKEMNEQEQADKEPEGEGKPVANLDADGSVLSRLSGKYLEDGDKEKSPPAEDEKVDKKKTEAGSGVKIASLNDDNKSGQRRRKKSEEEDAGGIDFGEFENNEAEKAAQEEKSDSKKKGLGAGVKITSLNDNDNKITRRRRKNDDEDEGGLDFGAFEEVEEKVEVNASPVKTGVKIASLDNDDNKITRRRRNKFDDEEEENIDFGNFEEEKKVEKAKPEPVAKTPKPEEKKQEPLKKDLKPAVKIASLQNDDTKITRRRKKKFGDDENEGGLDFGAFETKKEEKTEPEPTPEPPKEEEKKPVEKKEEPKKKDLRAQLGKGIKVASLNNEEPARPLRRKKERMFEDDEPVKPKEEEEEEAEEEPKPSKDDMSNEVSVTEENSGVRRRSKKSNEEEEKYDPFSGVGKKVAKLPSPVEVTRRRRKQQDEEEQAETDIFEAAAEATRKEEERLRKEKEEKEEAEKKKKIEEQRSKLADVESRKKKLSLEGGRKIVAKLEEDEQKPRRRRKKYEWEDENDTPPKPAEVETKEEKEKEDKVDEVEEEKKKQEEEEEKKSKLSAGKKIAALPEPETKFPSRRKKEEVKVEDPIAEFEKTQINAVRNAAKNLKGLPPPDPTPIRRRRRRDEEEEEKYDPFSSIPETTKPKVEDKKVEEPKKKEEVKPEPPKSPEPVVEDAAARRARRQREREEKARQQEEEEAAERKAKQERRAKEKEAETQKVEPSKEEKKGRWYTDEETKSGDRRFGDEAKEEAPTVDIFGGGGDTNDDGEPKKLSLRERLARRGR